MAHIYAIRQTLRTWSHDWGGVLTIVTLIIVIPCAVWMALELGDAETRNWLAQTGYLFFGAVAITLAFRIARAAHVPARIRRS
jgi:predicted membrane channel-forming protein YqfA (hemolysin III family)